MAHEPQTKTTHAEHPLSHDTKTTLVEHKPTDAKVEATRVDPARKAEYDKAVAAQHAAIVEAGKVELPEPTIAGYDETLPGQETVVAGSASHERLLNAYPNATSYGPDVNVVIPPEGSGGGNAPTNVDVPHVTQAGEVLSCTMGNWTGEPTAYAYQWKRGATNIGTNSATYTLVADDAGTTLTCVVSATNAGGTTVAPPSNGIVVPAARGSKN